MFSRARPRRRAWIEAHAIVGEFTLGPDEQYDGNSFALNPAFIDHFTGYMNDAATNTPDLVTEATRNPSGFLYLLDPRYQEQADQEPPVVEVIGAYSVDSNGAIVPDSFRYNDQHLLFNPTTGVSAMLHDQRFYEWLHTQFYS